MRVCLCVCARVFRRQALPVDFARGQLAGTPLCMEQYHRLFTSYRYPGRKTDTLKVRSNETSAAPQHVIVACKNQVRMQTERRQERTHKRKDWILVASGQSQRLKVFKVYFFFFFVEMLLLKLPEKKWDLCCNACFKGGNRMTFLKGQYSQTSAL